MEQKLIGSFQPRISTQTKTFCIYQSVSTENTSPDNRDQLWTQLKQLLRLRGQHTFMNTHILNTYLNRVSGILKTIDRRFIAEYAEGVDEQYDQFLTANMRLFGNCKVPICGFIAEMQTFRENCERFKKADTCFVVDYCNYAFMAHYHFNQVVKLLVREERSGAQQISSKAADQIRLFLAEILKASNTLNRTKLVINLVDSTTVPVYNTDEMCAAFESIKSSFAKS